MAQFSDVLVLSSALFASSEKLKKSNADFRRKVSSWLNAPASNAFNGTDIRQLATTALLGLTAASVAVASAILEPSSILLPAAGFMLAGTSLTALVILRRTDKKAKFAFPVLANTLAWVSIGSFLAATQPLVGAATVLVAAAAGVYALSSSNANLEAKLTPLDRTPQQFSTDHFDGAEYQLDGTIAATTTSFGFELNAGEKLVERIHLTDRVAFLRSISNINAQVTSVESVSVLVNTADDTKPARFKKLDLELRALNSSSIGIVAKDTAPEPQSTSIDNKGQDTNILAIVSHELRTPLNAIIGFSDLLKSDIAGALPTAKKDEYARLINDAGTHLLGLVNTILDVSKIEAGSYTINRDEFSFEQTANECVAMLSDAASKKNLKVNQRYLLSDAPAIADRRALKQILINLLSNAIKYTQEGGIITIDAVQSENEIKFEVSDTGVGMDTAAIANIGKPFTQVNSAFNRENEGTGLGLSLVKGLIALHDGQFEVRSKVGLGTRVMVRIPFDSKQFDKQSGSQNTLSKLTSFVPAAGAQPTPRHEVMRHERKIG